MQNSFYDINNKQSIELTANGFLLLHSNIDLIPYSELKLTTEDEYNAKKIPAIIYVTSNLEDGAYGLAHDVLLELDASLYYWIKRLNVEVENLEQILESFRTD